MRDSLRANEHERCVDDVHANVVLDGSFEGAEEGACQAGSGDELVGREGLRDVEGAVMEAEDDSDFDLDVVDLSIELRLAAHAFEDLVVGVEGRSW